MTSIPRLSVVVDPSWRRQVGHHPDVNAELGKSWARAGACLEVWTDRALAESNDPAIRGVFHGCGYEDPAHWSDVAGSLALARRLEGQLLEALRQRQEQTAVGAWIAHSLLPFQLLGLARALRHQPSATVLISLMFDPGETLEGALNDPQAIAHSRLALAALARAGQEAGHRLWIGVASRQQLQRWDSLLQQAGLPAAQLHGAVVGEGVAFTPAAEADPPRVLLHWGDLKPGKGRAEALELIQRRLEAPSQLPEQLRGCGWLFHSCSSDKLPEAEEALLRQAVAVIPGFLRIEGWQDQAAMLQLMASCQVALLAYTPMAYGQRSSGLLWCYAAARRGARRRATAVGYGQGWLAKEAGTLGVDWIVAPQGDWSIGLVEGLQRAQTPGLGSEACEASQESFAATLLKATALTGGQANH